MQSGVLGHSRKHPYHPQRGNWKLTPLPPLDVLIHLLLPETIFFSPPTLDGRNFLWECGSFLERPIKSNQIIIKSNNNLFKIQRYNLL